MGLLLNVVTGGNAPRCTADLEHLCSDGSLGQGMKPDLTIPHIPFENLCDWKMERSILPSRLQTSSWVQEWGMKEL
ncbi:hypothetical protein SKAU_G00135830 [Synaphobranchus kaupii]|uniref:Uncharacterized protein n=1 Tax=Synaphobranchus kaupii TaxID=118154 RepID=A0A9Q1FSB0_SYNKA|nr:hypothetical protein SKAU_G00135830 [Synaphobranchus kaupii]